MSNLLKAKEALVTAVVKTSNESPSYQILPHIREALDLIKAELKANPPSEAEVAEVESESELTAAETEAKAKTDAARQVKVDANAAAKAAADEKTHDEEVEADDKKTPVEFVDVLGVGDPPNDGEKKKQAPKPE
jgi:hypothetical protein